VDDPDLEPPGVQLMDHDETDSTTPLRLWHQYETEEERLSTEQALREWAGCEDEPDPDVTGLATISGGLYLTWIPDALRAGGCRVREEPGARTRGHGGMIAVRGILVHHTGSASMPGSRNVVRDGRSDLPGPLAQLTLDPDGVFSFIAGGQCWHPGRGGPLLDCPRDNGSPYLIGIEGVSNGTYWTDAQRREYPRGVAALLRKLGARSAEGWVAEHAEWAPGRKPDMGNWDPNDMRREVNRHLRGAPTEEGFMAGLSDAEQRELLDKTRGIHHESTLRLPNRRDVPGDDTEDTVLGYAANADKFSLHAINRINETAKAILALNVDLVKRLERIEAAVAPKAPSS